MPDSRVNTGNMSAWPSGKAGGCNPSHAGSNPVVLLSEGPKGAVLRLESAEVGESRRVGSSPAPSAQNAILLLLAKLRKDHIEDR